MSQRGAPNTQSSEIKQLLEENQQYLKLILNSTERTRKYILFGRIVSGIYLLLIVGSVAFAVVTLPPLINDAVGPYKELLNVGPTTVSGQQDDLFAEVQQFLGEYNQ